MTSSTWSWDEETGGKASVGGDWAAICGEEKQSESFQETERAEVSDPRRLGIVVAVVVHNLHTHTDEQKNRQ